MQASSIEAADDGIFGSATSLNAPKILPLATKTDNIPRGILAMIGATLCFALSSAFSKYQVALHPVGQVMFMRSITTLIVCAGFILPFKGLAVFKTRRVKAHVIRGFVQSISQTFSVLALSMLPLAGVISINFTVPIWAAVVSIIWLKERPGFGRWAFLVIGFIGVVIVTHPGSNSLRPGALFALANAIMYGSVTVAVRGMTKTESGNALLMWQVLMVAAFHALLLPFGFDRLSATDATMLVCSGIANALAQYLWTKSLQLGPATAVSPFYYLMLVWAMIIGFFAWGDVPSLALVVGSSIVVISGLLLLWHEAKRGKVPTLPNHTPATPAKL